MTTQALERARIGRTDVEVTRLGLGTAPLGGWPQALPREQALATVERAWELGIRLFDTAPLYGYGLAETLLGEALSQKPRDEFVLSTKVGRLLVPGHPEPEFFKDALPFEPVFDFSREGVERSLRESYERLGLDRVDIALVHDPDDHHREALAGAFPALLDARADGRLRAIGAGMNRAEPLARFAGEVELDCVLCAGRYTLFEQDSLDDLLPTAERRGVSIIGGGIYNGGLLVDPTPGATYDYSPARPDVLARARRLQDTCDEFGVPLRAAALQFPLAHPAVACVVVGARSPAEVEDNVRMLDTELPAGLWDALRERGLVRADAPTPLR